MKTIWITVLLAACCLQIAYAVDGQQSLMSWTCPIGWIPYRHNTESVCVIVSNNSFSSLHYVKEKCKEKGAFIIAINSEDKWTFAKDLMFKAGTRFWLGLVKRDNKLKWLRGKQEITATTLPEALRGLDWHQSRYRSGPYYQSYNPNTDIVSFKSSGHDYNAGRVLCEKYPDCASGWFGRHCVNECHCHGKNCDPKDELGRCYHGCQVGWMGPSCSKRKEDATLKYYCVDSNDLGRYVHIRIDTKGVHYDRVSAVNQQAKYIPWCRNNTVIEKNKKASVETIKIFMGGAFDQEIRSEDCAGNMIDSGYEWRIKLQEQEGFVSLMDQQFRITCDNSTDFDTMTLLAKTGISYEQEVFQRIETKDEVLDLEVVDAFDGSVASRRPIGTSVVLRIRFGLGRENDATGVVPYNCQASSDDGSYKSELLDAFGCPSVKSPISAFRTNGSKSLITEPFPLVSFPGTKSVHFDCDYTLCFDYDDCFVGCNAEERIKVSMAKGDNTDEGTTPDMDWIFDRKKRSTLSQNSHRVFGSIQVQYKQHGRNRK